MAKRSLPSHIGMAVLLAGLFSLAALIGGLFYMSAEQDRQAAAAERMMIEGGYQTWTWGLTSLTQDYAWWDDLLINTNNRDDAWFDSNVKTVVVPNETVDVVAVLDASLKPVYAWDKEAQGISNPAIIEEAFIADLRKAMVGKPAGKFPATFVVSSTKGQTTLFAFTRIYPADESLVTDAGQLPILVLGYSIGPARIAKLGEQFIIKDLAYLEGIDPAPHMIPVTAVDGTAKGYLAWTPSRPGTAVLRKAMVPLAVVTLLLLAGVGGLSAFARRQAMKLADREAEANALAQRAQEELLEKTKMANLGQLTATVAHEIRNPLGSVRTTAFLLRKKLGPQSPQDGLITRIENGVKRCDDIIGQLLDFARAKEVQAEPTNLDNWLENLLKEESEQLPPHIDVKCQLGSGEADAAFDPERLRRVLVNLLNNAAEAMQQSLDGSSPARAIATIAVATRRTERGFEIAVSDNGPGIPPDKMEAILEPFFTTKSFGTGLGLPACVNIMKNHSGGLDVKSEPGHGATFTAWFPAAQKPAA